MTTAPAAAVAAVAGAEDTAAAEFIARTLAAGGDHYDFPEFPGFPISPDFGNTIDAIIALSAVQTQQAQSDASLAYLEANVGDYIGVVRRGVCRPAREDAPRRGRRPAGTPPRSGATTSSTELRALETTEGRFSDRSAFGDFSNTIGQSLAVIALARAGQGINVGLRRASSWAGSAPTAGSPGRWTRPMRHQRP